MWGNGKEDKCEDDREGDEKMTVKEIGRKEEMDEGNKRDFGARIVKKEMVKAICDVKEIGAGISVKEIKG